MPKLSLHSRDIDSLKSGLALDFLKLQVILQLRTTTISGDVNEWYPGSWFSHRLLDLTTRVPDSSRLVWGPIMCMCNMSSGDAAAAALGTVL